MCMVCFKYTDSFYSNAAISSKLNVLLRIKKEICSFVCVAAIRLFLAEERSASKDGIPFGDYETLL